MMNAGKIWDVFSILHDGVIVSWEGNKSLLTLKVGCQYLAERIDKTYEYFYIELIVVHRLVLVPWMDSGLEQEYFVELNNIFEGELGILSVDIQDDLIRVSCNQNKLGFNYCGGFLYLNCDDIKVYDEVKNELSIDQIEKVCREYWDNFGGGKTENHS